MQNERRSSSAPAARIRPNHPLIEDVKRKDFTVGRSLADNEVLRGDLLETTLDVFRETAAFVAFLSEAVALL